MRSNPDSPLWTGQVHKLHVYADGSSKHLDSVDVQYRCVSERYAEDQIAKKLDYSDPSIYYCIELKKEN